MNHPATKKALLVRAVRRRRERGAALVEAAVVIPVMLVFLGLTMWVHNSYDEKLASQTSTRAGTLYYASHDCDEEVPENLSAQLGTKTSGGTGKSTEDSDTAQGADGPAKHAGTKLGDEEQTPMKQSWNKVTAHRDTSVSGTAVAEQKKVAFTVPITADSEVACNEKRYDSSWTAVFKFIPRFLKSGGGIIK